MIMPGFPRMIARAAGVPIIDLPVMTSNTAPAGHVASASSISSATYAAFRAFDGITNITGAGGSWQTLSGQATPSWVQREAPDVFQVIAYAITVNNLNRAPTAFNLQGSNDGSSFTTVDTRSGISWSSVGERQQFSVSSPAAFLMYRLNVTTNGGDTDFTRIDELELIQE